MDKESAAVAVSASMPGRCCTCSSAPGRRPPRSAASPHRRPTGQPRHPPGTASAPRAREPRAHPVRRARETMEPVCGEEVEVFGA